MRCKILLILTIFFLFLENGLSYRHHNKRRKHKRRNVVSEKKPVVPAVPSETTKLVPPNIYSLKVVTRIQSRFATTLVTSRLANPNNRSSEAHFMVQLPEAAFISNFSMQIGNRIIVGEVKEKAQARQEYETAKSRGQSAGHVAQNPRETNTFQISVNVGALEKVTFNLTYQEILQRVHSVYKHILNIQPGQVVDDLKVDVFISENSEITLIHVPEFGAKIGEKANKDILSLPESKDVHINSAITPELSHIHVTFQPSRQTQKQGLSGQLVVLYDVKREFDAGEIQVVNGYFVHFFAPSGLTEGKKHVVFVLDKSGSMQGTKIRQTKEAMRVILEDLNEGDHFNVLAFSDSVEHWKEESIPATQDQKRAATQYVNSISAVGGTNINDAIETALLLLLNSEAPTLAKVIIFLTDGQATVGEQRNHKILQNAMRTNIEQTISIHCIGFGANADFQLLQKLSIKNNGLARKVYEDSDAVLQLQGFYAEISKIMLTNVQVEYLNETVEPGTLVQDHSYNYYDGSEFVIVGKVRSKREIPESQPSTLEANIVGRGHEGQERFRVICPIWPPRPPRPIPSIRLPVEPPAPTPLPVGSVGGFVERMWAYLSIKKLLKEADFLEENKTRAEELKSRALQLSIKYNFVTKLTSMVVIQPDASNKTMTSLQKETQESDPQTSNGFALKSNTFHSRGYMMRPLTHRSHGYAAPMKGMKRLSVAHRVPHALDKHAPSRPRGSLHGYGGSKQYIRLAMTARPRNRKKPIQLTTTPTTLAPVSKKPKLPVCTGENEMVLMCGAQCQVTCDTYGKIVGCQRICNPPACGCKKGFVRNNNHCIRPRACPQLQCPANETLATGCFYDCQNKCGKPAKWEDDCPMLCDAVKCICRRGFVKNSTGNCVAETDCPVAKTDQCGVNETLSDCGKRCERACTTVYKSLVCPLVCDPPACKCKSGYVRHGRHCIQIKDCPDVCSANEMFTECGPANGGCEPVCGHPSALDESCEECGDATCICAEGFIRNNSAGGVCIPLEECDITGDVLTPEESEAAAEARQDSQESEEDELAIEDMCQDQCDQGCKRSFDDEGCGSCVCSQDDQEGAACESKMCPGHCKMLPNPDSGCWDCNCSESDRKLTYFLRYPIRTALANNIAAHVCVDFEVSNQVLTLLSTPHGSLDAKLTSVTRNNRIWATFENIMFHANSTQNMNWTRHGLPGDLDLVEETIAPCSCAEESVKLAELKNHLEQHFHGGIVGDARDKIGQSELLFDDTDQQTILPKYAQLVYRPNESERKVIATQLVARTHPIWTSEFQCYSVPYAELNL